MSFKEDLSLLYKEFKKDLDSVVDSQVWEAMRTKYVGKKGKITEFFKVLPTLLEEERKEFGQTINELREEVEKSLASVWDDLSNSSEKTYISERKVNLTLPGVERKLGRRHPLEIVKQDILELLEKLGFVFVESPEMEEDFYNFEALNIPENHPARDNQDSFYIDSTRLLRTHTTACDVRILEHHKPPISLVTTGRTFRRDAVDATHFPLFHQVDALYVDEGLNFSHLKGLVYDMCEGLFGNEMEIRFRPDYFPFTEPSCEISIRPKKSQGKWLEILGCGMLHPKILERFGIPSGKYKGIAFGLGVERIAMLRYGIDDIRHFFNNEVRFLEQFF